MKPYDFTTVWKPLRKRVRQLKVPWLDELRDRKRSPYEIQISCVLSLRTKDSITASSSKRLFSIARTPEAMAALDVKTVEKAIYPVGFYRVKAKTIRRLSLEIIKSHDGQVPDTMEGLLSLKGVGRKTANLVLASGFGKPAICVDTHVHRISNRWGLVSTRTPLQTEFALKGMIPRRFWKEINPTLVPFGQHICTPVSPFCGNCPVREICDRVGVIKHR